MPRDSFLKAIQAQVSRPVALVIGNGVHRYADDTAVRGWREMIEALAGPVLPAPKAAGLALTELYDIAELLSPGRADAGALQAQFCTPMSGWPVADHHRAIAEWAVAEGAPILTTNFDTVLASAAGARRHSLFEPHGRLRRPTDFYPWETYFAPSPLPGPCDGFGVWHINGMADYRRSIRLGLRHYMESAARAGPWIRDGLFGSQDPAAWRGRSTWLHVFFNMPLIFMGLGLGPEEVFLRWLIIERARYFRRFIDRRLPAWYVHPATEAGPADLAKYFFLQSLGVTPFAVEDYEAIYGPATWAAA